jgi:midasin
MFNAMCGLESPAVQVARLQELQLDVFRLTQHLLDVKGRAVLKKPSEMTQLELSIVAKTLPPHLKSGANPFAPFLFGCSAELATSVQHPVSLEIGLPSALDAVMQFCWDVFRLSQSKTFNRAEFQVYLQIGRSICSNRMSSGLDMIRVLSQLLEAFHAGWELTTGRSMQRIWENWRPSTPRTHEHLVLLTKLREVCVRFDQACLKTQLSHSELANLRTSLMATQISVLMGADARSLVSVSPSIFSIPQSFANEVSLGTCTSDRESRVVHREYKTYFSAIFLSGLRSAVPVSRPIFGRSGRNRKTTAVLGNHGATFREAVFST